MNPGDLLAFAYCTVLDGASLRVCETAISIWILPNWSSDEIQSLDIIVELWTLPALDFCNRFTIDFDPPESFSLIMLKIVLCDELICEHLTLS